MVRPLLAVALGLACGCTQDFDQFAPGDLALEAGAEDAATVIPTTPTPTPSPRDAAATDASDASVPVVPPTVIADAGHDAHVGAPDGGPDAAPQDAGADVVVSQCDLDGGQMHNGHCYFVTAAPPAAQLSWDDARLYCVSKGAHLVTISNAAEQTFVVSMMGGKDRWIGLKRPTNSPKGSSSFAWVNGEARPYNNWGMMEPNGTGECVRTRTGAQYGGSWGDLQCAMLNGAICERE